jgi:RHS repeat-associated protein
MKTRLNLNWLVVTVIALTGLLPTARAFYAPDQQRWLNRDPLSDKASPQLANAERRSAAQVEAESGANLYTFVLNNPCQLVDTDGRDWWPPSKWPIFGKPKPPTPPSPRPPRTPKNSPWCAGAECQAWAKGLSQGEPDEDACKQCCFEQFAQRQGDTGDVRNQAIIENCRRNCEKSGGLKGPKY